MTCPYLSHILRPPRRRLHLVVHHILALRSREALLDNFLDNLLRSDLLPLSDCSLARRAIRSSRRSPLQPPHNGEVVGSKSLVPLWRSATAWSTPGWFRGLWGGLLDSGDILRVGYRIPFDRRPPLSELLLSPCWRTRVSPSR